MDLRFPAAEDSWRESDVWEFGRQFFFGAGNDVEAMLWRARCMNALLTAGLGALIYAWSRRLFGPGGGMLSLLLYVTSPTILANGSLATADLAATAFFTLSVGALWKMFHRLSPATVVGVWLAIAGLALSKVSVVLLVPMTAVLLIVRLCSGRPLSISAWKEWVVARWPTQAWALLGVLLFQAILVIAMIWAFYGFRYSAFHPPLSGTERLYAYVGGIGWESTLSGTGNFGSAMRFARQNHLLPEAYLYGTALVYRWANARFGFLNGDLSLTGWWYFFPYTILVKTPLPTFLILALAALGTLLVWRKKKRDTGIPLRRAAAQAFYATAPLWTLLVVYWASALHSSLNIGHRHILPVYPATFILAGAAVSWFRRRDRCGRAASATLILCVVTLVAECYAVYPNYLAYFNVVVGGPSNGYKHLVDSSLDWGQDLPGLKRYLREHHLDGENTTPVYVGYFGTSSLSHYQIRAQDVATCPLWTEGVYCISATYLQLIYVGHPGPWTSNYEQEYQSALEAIYAFEIADPGTRDQMLRSRGQAYWDHVRSTFQHLRLARLCAYLRHQVPIANVGYSILIYRLTLQDVANVIFGPSGNLIGH
jgi:4-amino-4-deoxy-L-arabinose transferase-like glycosyltransferase